MMYVKSTLQLGMPACRNYAQQEHDFVHHFEGMWENKQYDLVRLPVSVPNKDALFIDEEPYNPSERALDTQGAEEMDDDLQEAPTVMPSSDKLDSEESESEDSTTTAQESTDAEIRMGTTSILITHDHEYDKLMKLSKEQSTTTAEAAREAVRHVQEILVETNVEAEYTYYHSHQSQSVGHVIQFKHCSEEWEEVPKHSRDETPDREIKGGARPKIRGRTETRHHL